MSEGDKTGRTVMKTSTAIKSLARIYGSSVGLVGASRRFAPGELSGRLTGAAFLGHLSLHASRKDLRALGDQLAAIAQHARVAHRTEAVDWASQAILTLPLPSEFQIIGRYYQAFCQQQAGQTEASRITLTKVADEGPPGYRERAVLDLGSSLFRTGDFQGSALSFVEAARATRRTDFLTHVQAIWNLAIVRSVDGDHRGSLQNLEQLSPVISALGRYHPTLYYDHFNSLAVEMSAVGRNREAKQIINKLLALPIAGRYPTWRETADEIAINEARGVSCPLTFAIWSPADAVSIPESSAGAVETPPATGTTNAVDPGSTAIAETESITQPEQASRKRVRVLSPCSIRWGVPPAVAANARELTNLQSAFPAISRGRLAWRHGLQPHAAARTERAGSRRVRPVPVLSEYHRFPLARGPPYIYILQQTDKRMAQPLAACTRSVIRLRLAGAYGPEVWVCSNGFASTDLYSISAHRQRGPPSKITFGLLSLSHGPKYRWSVSARFSAARANNELKSRREPRAKSFFYHDIRVSPCICQGIISARLWRRGPVERAEIPYPGAKEPAQRSPGRSPSGSRRCGASPASVCRSGLQACSNERRVQQCRCPASLRTNLLDT